MLVRSVTMKQMFFIVAVVIIFAEAFPGDEAESLNLSYSLVLPFFPSYSLFSIEIIFDVHYSFSETVKCFIPNVRALNIPDSFSMLSRYIRYSASTPSILMSTWLEVFFLQVL